MKGLAIVEVPLQLPSPKPINNQTVGGQVGRCILGAWPDQLEELSQGIALKYPLYPVPDPPNVVGYSLGIACMRLITKLLRLNVHMVCTSTMYI